MTSLRNRASAIIGLGLLVGATIAQASPVSVSFEITDATPIVSAGYGLETDAVEASSATLLDVRFTNSFSAQNATLSRVGESLAFDLGTVDFRELNSGGSNAMKITDSETDDLDVSWLLSFVSPVSTGSNLIATITAETGPIGDNPADFQLIWSDTLVNFDTGGQFGIHLNDLSFANSRQGPQTLSATVTLLALPQPAEVNQPVPAVPEPASLALVVVALAGLAVTRRHKH